MECSLSRNQRIESIVRNSTNWECKESSTNRIDVTWKKDGSFMKYGVASIDVSQTLKLTVSYATRYAAVLSDELMDTFINKFKNSVWRSIVYELNQDVSTKLLFRTKHINTGKFIHQLDTQN